MVFTRTVGTQVEAWQKGDTARALALHDMIAELTDGMFIESNPGPIKYAMQKIGLAAGLLRLPLVEIRQSSRPVLDEVLMNLGL